jgi:hypothetical protein
MTVGIYQSLLPPLYNIELRKKSEMFVWTTCINLAISASLQWSYISLQNFLLLHYVSLVVVQTYFNLSVEFKVSGQVCYFYALIVLY